MHGMATMWGRYSIFAVAVFGSFLQATSWAGTNDIGPDLMLIHWKGLRGFVEAISARTNPLPPLVILSNRFCENVKNHEERERIQKRRELGLALLEEIASASTNVASVRLSDIDDILAVRSWALREKAYGNLVLAYAAVDSASRLLLRLLADPASDVKAIRSRVLLCLRENPSNAYWTGMLEQEKDSVQGLADKVQVSDDYLKLAALFEELGDRKAKELGGGDFGFGGFGGDYNKCYREYNPAQVGYLSSSTSIRNIAVEACLVVREKSGQIPTEKDAFVSALRHEALSILTKRDRIGGRIDARIVWNFWREALCK